jgi:hypothetical protein
VETHFAAAFICVSASIVDNDVHLLDIYLWFTVSSLLYINNSHVRNDIM